MVKQPLLSVIIPTAARTCFLSRAIESALGIVDDCEVVVVPNGPSSAWKEVYKTFKSEPRVRWLPIEKAGVSAARNFGLTSATGVYIRFLDDDDFFYPKECAKQLEAMLTESLDMTSGLVRLVTNNGEFIAARKMLDVSDFCYAALHPSRCVQVGAHLYRRSAIAGLRWNESRSLNEDMQWLLDVACLEDLKWKPVQEAVAAWVQHDGKRLSRGSDPGKETLEYSANILLGVYDKLKSENNLSVKRKEALADGLWSLLQKGLRYDYKYWLKIARFADLCCPGRRPPSKIHLTWPVYLISPLVVESFLIPVRWLHAQLRKQ